MPQTTFSVRMDTEVKKQFDDFCANVGMNTSTAFNLFARAVLREKRLPFDITTASDPLRSKSNQASLREVIATLGAGKNVMHNSAEADDK